VTDFFVSLLPDDADGFVSSLLVLADAFILSPHDDVDASLLSLLDLADLRERFVSFSGLRTW